MKIRMRLCSACLLGIKCRYDGRSKANKNVIKLAEKEFLVPVCPEQLEDLPTPREALEISEIVSYLGKEFIVFTKTGKDVSENFIIGAEAVLKLAELFHIKEAIFKQRSPSCGAGKIYDGTFSGKEIYGNRITTRLLQKKGITVISEEDL